MTAIPPPPPYDPPPRTGRDAKGRFAQGNPGKPVGARCRSTVIVESILQGNAAELAAMLVAVAKKGDTTALRIAFDRISPVRRGRPTPLADFPTLTTAADVPRALARLTESVMAGELTAEEAKPIAEMLGVYASAYDTAALAERLADLEQRLTADLAELRRRNPGGSSGITFNLDTPEHGEG